MSNNDLGKLNDRDLRSLNELESLSENEFMAITELARLHDQELFKSLGKAIDGEITQTTFVLRHLILVEERKLYAQNHSSLFDFLTRQYRYSENAAQRRIDAARLLREFPSLEPKIQSRAHSLTNLSLARSLFRQEKKRKLPFSREKKLEVLSAIEGKSTREASIYLLSQSSAPELLKKCKSAVRALGGGYTSIKIFAHEELTADLYHIRDLWAHAVPDGDWTEVMKRMMKLTLESIDPLKKAERAKARKERSQARESGARMERSDARTEPAESRREPSHARKNDAQRTSHQEKSNQPSIHAQDTQDVRTHQDQKQVRHNSERERSCHLQTQKEVVNEDHSARSVRSTTGGGSADFVHSSMDTPSRALATPQADTPSEFNRETGDEQVCFHLDDPLEPHPSDQRRPLAASIRQAVNLRDRAGGCTHIDEYGNRCGSHRALEYDHIIPYALGGPDTVENVRLICREHNSYSSYRVFGQAAFHWRDAHYEKD
jgi:5-methylcytosine-specific restriction endonuclease McrA